MHNWMTWPTNNCIYFEIFVRLSIRDTEWSDIGIGFNKSCIWNIPEKLLCVHCFHYKKRTFRLCNWGTDCWILMPFATLCTNSVDSRGRHCFRSQHKIFWLHNSHVFLVCEVYNDWLSCSSYHNENFSMLVLRQVGAIYTAFLPNCAGNSRGTCMKSVFGNGSTRHT